MATELKDILAFIQEDSLVQEDRSGVFRTEEASRMR